MTDQKEKMFEWTRDKIRWYADAASYSGNDRNEKTAEAVLSRLPPKPRLCEFGCGIGCLSLVMAPDAELLVCIDINPDALAELERSAQERGIYNINTKLANYETLPPPQKLYDAVVLCMAGGAMESFDAARRWTNGKVFYIIDTSTCRSFSASRERRTANCGFKRTCSFLDSIAADYEKSYITAQAGQPFRSFEEALSFMACYDRKSSTEKITEFLRKRLVATDDVTFPLFLPNEKTYMMISVNI
jgi:SAM-dependent methyltransferase